MYIHLEICWLIRICFVFLQSLLNVLFAGIGKYDELSRIQIKINSKSSQVK